MNPSKNPDLRIRTNRRSFAFGRALALAATIGLASTSAFAGSDKAADPKAADAGKAPVTTGDKSDEAQALEFSPYELAYLLRDRMTAYTFAPKATENETAVRDAWRNALKRRAGRMMARMERVMDSKRWNVRAASIDEWATTEAGTSAVLRELARLYVEVAASHKSVSKARIVEKDVLYFGHVPGRRGRKPTMEAEIKGVRNDTYGEFGFKSLIVPGPNPGVLSLKFGAKQSRRKVKVKIFDREVEERLKAQKQAKIDAQVALIRARIDAYTTALEKDMELIRVLTASLQLAEEMRLADQIAQITNSAEQEKANRLLDLMKVSRIDARRRMFKTASQFGSAISRGWLQKRTKLERLIEREAKRG